MADPDQQGAAPLRLGFAGTPAFARTILEALTGAGRAPVVVYTQPDRPAGRGRKGRNRALQPSPVKALAEQHGLPVRQPASLRGAEQAEALAAWHLDVLVVAAYGLILPPSILAVPRYGCVNVHASLLPRWRGAAPVERAIMAGDPETGVCIMQMERGLDTGPVYECARTPIGPDTDGTTLEDTLARLGGETLLGCLADLPDRTPTPQSEAGVTYAAKLTQADAVIDWSRSAVDIERQVRALCGRLPAFTFTGGARITVLAARVAADVPAAVPGEVLAASAEGIRIACGEGALDLTRLRLSVGKGNVLRPADAVNGYGALFAPGLRLEAAPSP